MCGILGVAVAPGSAVRVEDLPLERARDTLAHRGPDDRGLYRAEKVALAHRRLTVVDLEGGHQPFGEPEAGLQLVYNGEVYNHPSLRRELEAEGDRYRTRCDTETVLKLFRRDREACVRRLRGMFAFAVWDERRGELFLARDRLGVKPLYYVHSPDGTLWFASEIKALLALGAVEPALEYEVLPDYLANHAPSGAHTLFRGVRRLPPGHTLRWREGEVEIRRYWRPDLSPREPGDGASVVRRFRERFEESVRLRLMADVPLGVFLSGGLDSASITAVMSRLVDEPVRSFSVAFAERSANELGYARLVAEAFGTEHHEVVVSPEQFFEALPRLVWHEDEPLAHPSSVPLHFVSELASQHVKVVLTGEGSDELLGGYARHWKTLWNLRLGRAWTRFTPTFLRRAVRTTVTSLPPGLRAGQLAGRSFLAMPVDLRHLYLENFAVFASARQAELLTTEARERIGEVTNPYRVQDALLKGSAASSSPLTRVLEVDLHTYLHELLMKQDQMSMSASIESRVPFLDQELVEFATGLPDGWKVRGSTTKRVLREAMEGILPPEILTRRKMGFPVPIGAWFRGSFQEDVDEILTGERTRERGLFEPDQIERMIREHAAGVVDHDQRLWSLLNLELWQRIFVDGEPVSEVGLSPGRNATAGARCEPNTTVSVPSPSGAEVEHR